MAMMNCAGVLKSASQCGPLSILCLACCLGCVPCQHEMGRNTAHT